MGPRKKYTFIFAVFCIFILSADSAKPVGTNGSSTKAGSENTSALSTIQQSSTQIAEILLSTFGNVINKFIPCLVRKGGLMNCLKTIEVTGLTGVLQNIVDIVPDRAIAQPVKYGLKFTVSFISDRLTSYVFNSTNSATQNT